MKILLVSYSIRGGAGKAAYRLCKALNKQIGIEAQILILEGSSIDLADVSTLYSSKRELFLKQILNTPRLLFYKSWFGTRNSQLRIPRSIHRVKGHDLVDWADVINLHWVAEFIDYNHFFSKVQKPVVWTLHDMLPFSGGYHYKYDSSQDRKLKNSERIIEKYKEKCIRASKLSVVAPSEWLVNISMQSTVFKIFPQIKIYNTLDQSIYKLLDQYESRRALNIPTDKKVILFSADGVNNLRKGFDILSSSLSYLAKEELHLLILGRGGLGIENRFSATYLGNFEDEISMVLAYNSADVTLVSSREDNMPNAVIESMACGCPVVGLPIGGLPEIIKNGINGAISTSENPCDLARAIESTLDMNLSRVSIVNYISDLINEDKIAKKYVSEFKKLSIEDNA